MGFDLSRVNHFGPVEQRLARVIINSERRNFLPHGVHAGETERDLLKVEGQPPTYYSIGLLQLINYLRGSSLEVK